MVHREDLHALFLEDVAAEIARQEDLWGVQVHPAGVGTAEYENLEKVHRNITEANADRGMLTWADILLEEVYEALGAHTPNDVVTELVQVAAVASSMARYVSEFGLE